jgi:hypothetical protein
MSEEAERKRRERIDREVAENLSKPTPQLLAEIYEAAESGGLGDGGAPITKTMARFASLLCVLSTQADIQSRRIVRLTWILVLLTIVLLFFTVYLSYDTYLNGKRANEQKEHHAEERK